MVVDPPAVAAAVAAAAAGNRSIAHVDMKQQTDLFDGFLVKQHEIDSVADSINERFGSGVVHRGLRNK